MAAVAAIFDSPSSENRVQNCINVDSGGDFEHNSVCLYRSPGPVLGEESVSRFVFSPQHISRVDQIEELDDSFFSDVFTHGLSVQRIVCPWALAKIDVHRRGIAQASEKESARIYLGSIRFTAGVLRDQIATVDTISISIRVYDTPLRGNDLHAEVMAVGSGGSGKTAKRARQLMRVKLLALANRSGLFHPESMRDSPHLKNVHMALHV